MFTKPNNMNVENDSISISCDLLLNCTGTSDFVITVYYNLMFNCVINPSVKYSDLITYKDLKTFINLFFSFDPLTSKNKNIWRFKY